MPGEGARTPLRHRRGAGRRPASAGSPASRSAPARSGRWSGWRCGARRRPAVAALSALVVAVALSGAGLVTWKWRDAVVAEKAAREQGEVAKRGEELEKSLGETKRALYVSNVTAWLSATGARGGSSRRAGCSAMRPRAARLGMALPAPPTAPLAGAVVCRQRLPGASPSPPTAGCRRRVRRAEPVFLARPASGNRVGGSLGPQHSVASLALSPDGQHIAGATYHDTGFSEPGVLRSARRGNGRGRGGLQRKAPSLAGRLQLRRAVPRLLRRRAEGKRVSRS